MPPSISCITVTMPPSFKRHQLGLLKKPTGGICDEEEVADILLDEHAPGSYEAPEKREKPKEKLRNVETRKLKFMTIDLLREALNDFGRNKRGGPDGLTAIMLQNLPNNVLKRLLMIIKASILTKYVPTIWLNSEIIFIPKPGKYDYMEPRSFRPITLQSFVFKVIEKMSMAKLKDTFYRAKPFHSNQHAFRTGRSCDSALSQVTDFIESSLGRKEYALGLFLDIKGAFDNLDQKAALALMRKNKYPDWFVDFYESYLNDRVAICQIGKMTRRKLPTGSPQGGVFSPSFWNAAFDELLEIINKEGNKLGVGFADDCALLARGPVLSTLVDLIQDIIPKIEGWSRKYGVKFCPKKTVAVIFHKKPPARITPEPQDRGRGSTV